MNLKNPFEIYKNTPTKKKKTTLEIESIFNNENIEEKLESLNEYIYKNDVQINEISFLKHSEQSSEKSTKSKDFNNNNSKPSKILRKKNDLKNMVLVPKKNISIGSEKKVDEMPIFKKEISSFYVDKNFVTVKEFLKIFPHSKLKISKYKYLDEPVRGVTWNEANSYAKLNNKRLITEFEWIRCCEYIENNYLKHSIYNKRKIWDNYRINNYKNTFNIFSIRNLFGLLWEWTDSWYLPYKNNFQRLEEFGFKYKVIKGGCWYSSTNQLRKNLRKFKNLNMRFKNIGFRCVKDFV